MNHLSYHVKLGPWLLRLLAGIFVGLPLFGIALLADLVSAKAWAGYRKLDEKLPDAWVLGPAKNQPPQETIEWDA